MAAAWQAHLRACGRWGRGPIAPRCKTSFRRGRTQAPAHRSAGRSFIGGVLDGRGVDRAGLPWFNFFETYTDGAALGIAVGSTKMQAIEEAERAGLEVAPSGWGDNRAGGADLYERPELVSVMLRQAYLSFHDAKDLKRGMIVNFRGDRVVAVRVYYINSEGI